MGSKKAVTKNQRIVLNTYTKMMRATNSVTMGMHKHLADHRLTVSQFGVLEALYHLGPLCQRDIGNKILKTSGNITLVIDNLEKRNLVNREKDKNDRRYMTVNLTKKGKKLISKIFPLHARIAEQVFSSITTEEMDMLGKIMKVLGKACK